MELKPLSVKVTRIAYGLPMGGEIKYADRQTLKESLSHRVEA
jgi:recombination protein RecR